MGDYLENKKQPVRGHSHPHVHLHKHSHLHRREGEVLCELCGYSHDGMKIEEKDGVINVAGVRIVEGDYDALEEQAITEMEMLTQWVKRQGGITGHVRTYLEERGSASSLTCAGGQNEREQDQCDFVRGDPECGCGKAEMQNCGISGKDDYLNGTIEYFMEKCRGG